MNAVITWSNITCYHLQHCSSRGRTYTRICSHKDTPYLTLSGKLWGVHCENLEENWLNIMAQHCTSFHSFLVNHLSLALFSCPPYNHVMVWMNSCLYICSFFLISYAYIAKRPSIYHRIYSGNTLQHCGMNIFALCVCFTFESWQNQTWQLALNRPIARYYSHLVAARGRGSRKPCVRVVWTNIQRKVK